MLCLNQITFLPVRMLNYLKLSFFLFLPNGYFFSSLILLWLAVMLAAEQFINLCQERFMYLFIDTTAASREPRTFNSKSVAPLLSLQWFKEVHTQQPALCLMCVFMGNVVCFYAFPGIWLENIFEGAFQSREPTEQCFTHSELCVLEELFHPNCWKLWLKGLFAFQPISSLITQWPEMSLSSRLMQIGLQRKFGN